MIEAKTLTAQKYCLQCIGTGAEVTCSYGTATPDTPLIFTAVAGTTVFTSNVNTLKWMLSAAGGYAFPYIPPGTSVASTAATSAGNGLAIPMDAKMTTALGGIFTAAAIVNMRASSAEVTADTNILAVNNNITGGIYMASGGVLKAFDGTNTATVTVAGGWPRDEEMLICWWINAAGTNQQIGYKKSTDAAITWGAAAAYDGSVNPGTHLRYGYTIDKPLGIIHSHLWNKSVATDAEILAFIEKYVDPGYLLIYTSDSDGAYILDSDGAEVYEDA